MIILISEEARSPQLEAIVESLQSFKPKIIFFGESKNPLLINLKINGYDVTVIQLKKRWPSLIQLYEIFSIIVNTPSNLILASGYVAHTVGVFLGFATQKKFRIYIRHFTNTHYRLRYVHWWVLDVLLGALATNVICVSQLVADVLHKCEFVSRKKLIVINNGIDLESLKRIRARRQLVNRTDNLVIIVARQVTGKGILYAIDACLALQKESKPVRLHLFGDFGELSREIECKLNEFPFGYALQHGRIEDTQIIYQNARAIVHVPETPEYESFGLVYLEALAAGVQCVFTRSGILNSLSDEFVENNIWFVDFKNSLQIKDALAEILIDGKNRPMIPISSLDKYSLTNVANAYRSFIASLANQ